jgi:hypothetical protein
MRLAARDAAVAAHLNEHGRNLQQRIGLRIEPAGFDVDDDGEKPAKPRREGDGRQLHHGWAAVPSRQPIAAPAR